MYKAFFKRFFDIILSFLGIVLLSWMFIFITIAIVIDDPGPVLFKQKRLGLGGKVFNMLKFRSMIQNAEHTGTGVYSNKNDSRITRVGRFLRATSLDELPQLINILKGDMSLIGPRPPLTYHPWPINEYTEGQKRMFDVRPGITGWAQINGRKEVEWNTRIELNGWYVDNVSFLLDLLKGSSEMNLLITGAWNSADKHILEIESLGHKVLFMQNEADDLPCEYGWTEGVVCNGLFLYHPIKRFRNLKYIQITSAGFDRVPIDYVNEKGIIINNARGVYSIPMAEFAVCGVLQLYKKSTFFYENQKTHLWLKNHDLQELYLKTVCIIGCGSVLISIVYVKGWVGKAALTASVLILLFLPWGSIFGYLSGVIDNTYISQRFFDISYFFSNGYATGGMAGRTEAYLSSLQTFFKHPFGIGAHYSYVMFENGIGYHSQILDDLARYGVFALAFYIAFLSQYYRLLKRQWSKINMSEVVFPMFIVYLGFLTLNIAFRSSAESIVMLFILPVLPDIIQHKNNAINKIEGQNND